MASTTGTTSTQTNSVIQKLMQSSSSTSASNGNPTTATGLEDRFLTLLVTQMQNQDPLNPMDNAELTSQLAQINTLKGITTLNTTLETLLSSYTDSMSMQSASMIGKNVLSAGKNLSLTANGAVGGVNLAGKADHVNITVYDASGKKVLEKDLGAKEAGVIDFVWDGKDSDGKALAQGDYTFAVSAKQAGETVDATALQLGTISALIRTANGFQLEIPGTGQVDFDAVQKVY